MTTSRPPEWAWRRKDRYMHSRSTMTNLSMSMYMCLYIVCIYTNAPIVQVQFTANVYMYSAFNLNSRALKICFLLVEDSPYSIVKCTHKLRCLLSGVSDGALWQ